MIDSTDGALDAFWDIGKMERAKKKEHATERVDWIRRGQGSSAVEAYVRMG